MKISFIGSGNTATQLAIALHEKGVTVSQILSFSQENASALAQKVNAQAGTNLAGFKADFADILLIAVTDDKTAKMAQDIAKQTNVIVAHCSGATEMKVLNAHEKFGVFYPFVSMQKNIKTDFSGTTFMIEGSDISVTSQLKKLAGFLSENVIEATSQQRAMLHLAAVFANNFANSQLVIAEEILAKNDLPFSLLRPLLASYFEKLKTHLPHELQTGPAVRNDTAIIAKHLHLLQTQPAYQNIYALLTETIQRQQLSVTN